MIRRIGHAHNDLLARLQIADTGVIAVFQAHGVDHLQFLSAFELFIRLDGRERIFHGKFAGTQILHKLERLRPQGFILDQDENVRAGIEFRQQPSRLEKFQKHHVAHAETERGQIHPAAADELDEVVVATAAGNGAKLALDIKGFKDDAGVVGKSRE